MDKGRQEVIGRYLNMMAKEGGVASVSVDGGNIDEEKSRSGVARRRRKRR